MDYVTHEIEVFSWVMLRMKYMYFWIMSRMKIEVCFSLDYGASPYGFVRTHMRAVRKFSRRCCSSLERTTTGGPERRGWKDGPPVPRVCAAHPYGGPIFPSAPFRTAGGGTLQGASNIAVNLNLSMYSERCRSGRSGTVYRSIG